MSRSRPDVRVPTHTLWFAARLTSGAMAFALAACQAGPPPSATKAGAVFRMQSADAGAAPVAPAGRTEDAPGTAAAPARAAGALVVKFDALLARLRGTAARRLQAAADQVDRVTVRLAGPAFSREEVVSAAMLATGTTSVTFTNLPFIDLTVTIEAYDPGGRLLAQDVRKATISPQATTTVETSAVVTGTPPASAPASASGGGSGGSSGSGGSGGPSAAGSSAPSVRAQVTLIDGAAVRDLIPIRSRFAGYNGADIRTLVIAADGGAWVDTGPALRTEEADGGGHLFRVGPDGATTIPDPGQFVGSHDGERRLAANETTGAVYVYADTDLGGQLYMYGGDGSLLEQGACDVPLPTRFAANSQGRLAFGSYGDAWFAERLDDAWTFRVPVNFGFDEDAYVTQDAGSGDFWFITTSFGTNDAFDGNIKLVTATNQVPVDLYLPGEEPLDAAADASGRLWYVTHDGRSIVCLTKDGSALTTTPVATAINRVHVDASGDVWGYLGTPACPDHVSVAMSYRSQAGGLADAVVRLASSGGVRAYYHLGVGADITELAVSSTTGKLWAGTGLHGLLEYDVDVPFVP